MASTVVPSLSRAIPIIAPTPEHSEGRKTPTSPVKKHESKTLCKNVIIYGSCRNEGKGCMFAHPAREDAPPKPSPLIPPLSSPMMPPLSSPPSVNVNAPVFVPRGVPVTLISQGSDITPGSVTNSPDTSVDERDSELTQEFAEALSLNDEHGYTSYASTAPYISDPAMTISSDPYFSPSYPLHPLNYHLYSQLSVNVASDNCLFISDTLREDLQKTSNDLYAASSVSAGLPDEVHTYHSLVLLDFPIPEKRKFWAGWTSSTYKALNRRDGRYYALRRIEGFRLLHEAAFGAIEKWSKISHPNIVPIKEAFTSRQFGDHSLVFAYNYFPNSQTLYTAHFSPSSAPLSPSFITSTTSSRQSKNARNNLNSSSTPSYTGLIPEHTIWSYIIQIASALKAVHESGLAVRLLDISKILLVGKNRVRLNCCGIFDVVAYNPVLGIDILQQEDLIALGRLIYLLGTLNINALNEPQKAMQTLIRTYSPDLNQLAYFLVSPPKPGQRKSIDDVLVKMGSRLVQEMDAARSYNDELESRLMGELENGRLVRLLSKFGFINERPDFGHESRWSETGDRYIVKLFRDFVFHQVDENGRPVVNMSHVLTCLNKLDAGTEERIMLVSRDEQSCLVVSYKEVKSCIEQTFGELTKSHR